MDMIDRIAQAKRSIAFIATKYDETDAAIDAALGVLAEYLKNEANGVPAGRLAHDNAVAAKAKLVADNLAAHLAAGGKVLPPISGKIGL